MNESKVPLWKQERCDNEDREHNRCSNLTVFKYRGNDGEPYRLCLTCIKALMRIAPGLRF